MNLGQYVEKNIRVVTNDGQEFMGIGDYHISALDNPDGVATICVGDFELREDEIVKIELIDISDVKVCSA